MIYQLSVLLNNIANSLPFLYSKLNKESFLIILNAINLAAVVDLDELSFI